jgi:hypothetical protein
MKRFFLALCFVVNFGFAQVFQFTSQLDELTVTHRILMDTDYLIETQFVNDPPQFISTRGGFYSKEGNTFLVDLEFNSSHAKDSLTTLKLISDTNWKNISKEPIDLNGKWLMAGRVRD